MFFRRNLNPCRPSRPKYSRALKKSLQFVMSSLIPMLGIPQTWSHSDMMKFLVLSGQERAVGTKCQVSTS